MSDHIDNDLTADIAIASALRTFLTSPAIISMIQACVTEAAAAEVQRLMSDDRILNTISSALKSPATAAQSRLSDTLGYVIRGDIEEATKYFLNEDSARDFIREELEDEPRYFLRAIETAVDANIDTDSIADTVKDKVVEEIDLGDDIADKIGDYFDDDDNIRSITKRVIDSISITITPSV
jgi:hypothetical protein